MSLPGFNAEASLYNSAGHFHAAARRVADGAGQVVPQQTNPYASWWQCGRCWTRCRVTGQGEDFCNRFCDFWCSGGRVY
jgi:hypothetical protein